MSRVKMLYVLVAIVVGLLLVLLVGVLIQPEDGKQPTGTPPVTMAGRPG
jgi:hypothetical protein